MTKIHKGPPVVCGIGVVAERPSAAVALANVVSEWSFFESNFVRLYAFLMSRWSDHLPTATHMPLHPVGMLTFEELPTLHQRINLLGALARWALETREAEQIEALFPKIRKRSKQRNTIVHGIWGIADNEPENLVLMQPFKKNLVYSAKDFKDVSADIEQLNAELETLVKRLVKHVTDHGWREPAPNERPSGIVLG